MYVFIIVVCGLAAGCATPQRAPAVPRELQDRAIVPGMSPAIRTWGYALSPEFLESVMKASQREQTHLAAIGHTGPLPPAVYLAISGGGQDGTFTAGLLNGWTASGTRPEFKMVTGISTGALIAPFAYLGPEYDPVLKKFYTTITTKDVLKKRGVLAAVFEDALADNKPLRELLDTVVDQHTLDAIAAEYAKGRLLFIGTTNLDARRAVIWDIGAIASSKSPQALPLIRNIMIASAAIPAAFPPVLIDVEVDGKPYQEMHVDGGAMTQVFLYPPSFKLKEAAAAAGTVRERRGYIIRNARLDPDWADVQPRTLSIASRAIGSLIQTQGIGDLYRIYLNAQRDDIDYNLAYIPRTFDAWPREAFDREYMSQLYQLGYDMAVKGYPWEKTPPAYDIDTTP